MQVPVPHNASSVSSNKHASSAKAWRSQLEWPTLILFAFTYIGWLGLVVFHQSIPLLLLIPSLCLLVVLHSSLQHEVIHGHPTNSTLINTALAFPALGLLVPYERYEILHLQHHRNWLITDPLDDSESYFLAQTQWEQCNKAIRALLNFNNTLFGRLLLGPAIMLVRMCVSEFSQFNDKDILLSWLKHIPAVLIVFVTLLLVDFSLVLYFLTIAYPAMSILMIRSYSEHLPERNIEHRSAIVKSNMFMQLLYLNNNFHRVHHDFPEVPWYELPKLFRQNYKDHDIHVYPGYFHLFKRFGFKQRYPVEHPFLK